MLLFSNLPFPTGNGKCEYLPYVLNEKQQHENHQQNAAAAVMIVKTPLPSARTS